MGLPAVRCASFDVVWVVDFSSARAKAGTSSTASATPVIPILFMWLLLWLTDPGIRAAGADLGAIAEVRAGADLRACPDLGASPDVEAVRGIARVGGGARKDGDPSARQDDRCPAAALC